MSAFSIARIAQELNTRAAGHPIGALQDIRKLLKGLARRPGHAIFSSQTIDKNDEWAFHHGGRAELQFNVGRDGNGNAKLRHGVAFSFETSRTLPTISVLEPKVRHFNEYLTLYPDHFAGMRMWHWDRTVRCNEYSVAPILPELVRNGVFVFLSRLVALEDLDYDSILDDFDSLLPLFRYVESDGTEQPVTTPIIAGFSFQFGCTIKSKLATVQRASIQLDANLRHNLLQEALHERLVKQFGNENVGTELSSGVGTRIDLVVRRESSYWFYEIKTAHSPRACIREALSQLLEYSFWPGAHEAERLIVVGESPLDCDGTEYLSRLRERFSLPIYYEHISI